MVLETDRDYRANDLPLPDRDTVPTVPKPASRGLLILTAVAGAWMLRPRRRVGRDRGVGGWAVTTGIELSQLLHSPPLDTVRLTPVGALLLGRVFALTDLALYPVAVAIASQLDNLRPKQRTG